MMKTFCAVLWLTVPCFPLLSQVLLKEDFTKKGRFPEDSRSYYYHGAYHVYGFEASSQYDKSKTYKDFTAEVRTEFISGDTTAYYGLHFRHDSRVNGYTFIISAIGRYFLQRNFLKPGEEIGAVEVKTLTNGNADSIVNKRGVNYLKVECRGNFIRLFINGHWVDSFADSTYNEGIIGIWAEKEVHVHFDDLTVYKKNVTGKYSFRQTIPDSSYDEKSDSLTVRLMNFNKSALVWKDFPGAFCENGLYTIDTSAYLNNYIYNENENFSIRMTFKIRDWPQKGKLAVSWYPVDSGDETEIGIMGDSSLVYVKSYQGIRYTFRNFPFLYESGTLVRLKIDKKDSDTKVSVNNKELVLFIDESYGSEIFKWIEFRTNNVGIDLYSIIVFKPANGNYGLDSKDMTCPVIRVTGNKEIGRKPVLEHAPIPIPEDESFFWNFVKFTLIVALAQLLLIWGAIRWYKSRSVDRNHFVNFLRDKNGSFLLNEFASRFRVSRKKAVKFLDQMIKDYQGYQYPIEEGDNRFYDFPSFMSEMPKTNFESSYPEFIEHMIVNYSKRINLPNPTARLYFVQICTLAAHLQGRLSIHTLTMKIDEGSFELNRGHFSSFRTTGDIVSFLTTKIIDSHYITLLSEDTPTVLKFHEDLIKHFTNP